VGKSCEESRLEKSEMRSSHFWLSFAVPLCAECKAKGLSSSMA
jgi:hypothetical protein